MQGRQDTVDAQANRRKSWPRWSRTVWLNEVAGGKNLERALCGIRLVRSSLADSRKGGLVSFGTGREL